MIRAKYHGQEGTAWRCMVDADVWMFQADTSEQAHPVLQGELRILESSTDAPCEDTAVPVKPLLCVLALGLVLLILLTEGWFVAARVSVGLGAICWIGWILRKEGER